MKIYIGTANWGKPYGMNQVKVSNSEIDKILTLADKNDCGIETAWDYDCMDKLRGLGDQFDIIFKGDMAHQFDWAFNMIGEVSPMKHHAPYGDYDSKSVYNPTELTCDEIDIELPYNIIDQRFNEHIGTVNSFCIARSIFIQGLAFKMPDFHGIPFYHLCWNFVRNNPCIDGIVVGVDTAEQLQDILTIPRYEIDYSKIGRDGWFKTL